MKILILEDEPRTAGLLKEFILAYSPKMEVLDILDSLEESLDYLENHEIKPDLIFMDIQLSDGNSFELFLKASIPYPVIFCTAFEEFTLQAFRNNGIDYILKPFTQEDIFKALKKAENMKVLFGGPEKKSEIDAPIKTSLNRKIQYFLVSYRDKMYPIAISSVAVIFLEDEKTYLINLNRERYPIQKKMDEIEKLLDPSFFFRINRQMIIQRESIDSIENYFNRKLFIKLKVPCPIPAIVSRLKVSRFTDWIEIG